MQMFFQTTPVIQSQHKNKAALDAGGSNRHLTAQNVANKVSHL